MDCLTGLRTTHHIRCLFPRYRQIEIKVDLASRQFHQTYRSPDTDFGQQIIKLDFTLVLSCPIDEHKILMMWLVV